MEQTGKSIVFGAFFTASKVGKTGLTVTVDVYRLGSNVALVTAASATEVGDGLYTYTLANTNTSNSDVYAAVFKTTDATVDQQHIVGQETVGATWAQNIDATVSSRLAAAGYTAPDNADITAIKAKTDNLPADPASNTQVNTRLATSSYVAPDNADIATILTRTDVATSTRLAGSSYVAPDNTDIATILTRTDVATSSRLAASSYVAPDNADITAIKAKTDNLPTDPASNTEVDTRLAAVDYTAPDNADIAASLTGIGSIANDITNFIKPKVAYLALTGQFIQSTVDLSHLQLSMSYASAHSYLGWGLRVMDTPHQNQVSRIVAVANMGGLTLATIDPPLDSPTPIGNQSILLYPAQAAVGGPADVWAYSTRALTDKADFALSAAAITAIANAVSTGGLDPADIAHAVWDENLTTHSTPDSAGLDLAEAYLQNTPGAIANAVWTEPVRALTDKTDFALSDANAQHVASYVNVGGIDLSGLVAMLQVVNGNLTSLLMLPDVAAFLAHRPVQTVNDDITGYTVGDDFSFMRTLMAVPDGEELAYVWITIKRSLQDADADALIQKQITANNVPGVGQITDTGASGNGVVRIDFTPEDGLALGPMTRYHYDIQGATSAGHIKTYYAGLFQLNAQVTRIP